jgi:hypothetical protein
MRRDIDARFIPGWTAPDYKTRSSYGLVHWHCRRPG